MGLGDPEEPWKEQEREGKGEKEAQQTEQREKGEKHYTLHDLLGKAGA